MGLIGFVGLESSGKKSKPSAARYSKEMLHKAECAACPLNSQVGLKHPHMKPTGSETPTVYILGEAPGVEEDKKGEHFIGKSGAILRERIPPKWEGKLRWNNVIRTHPPGNKTPTYIEIECCRPSVVRDIEKSKPKAIFGFGNIPLTWATGLSGISFWCGRYMPVKIGEHVCWFFPMYHPSYIVRGGGGYGSDGYESEEEFAFELHLERAFKLVEKLPKAKVYSKIEAEARVRCVDGSQGDADVKDVLRHLERFAAEDEVGLDYETNAIRPFADGTKILTAAIGGKDLTYSFVLRHKQSAWSPKQLRKVEGALVEFLEQSECLKLVHNLPFELEWSVHKFGKATLENGRWGCSQSQAYVLDERAGSGVQSLDGLCQQYFGISIKSINPVDRANLDDAPLPQVLLYNGVDAKFHRLLFLAQRDRVESEGLAEQYYHNLERMAGLTLVQAKGAPVNAKRVAELDAKYTKKIADADKALMAMDSVQKFGRLYGRPFKPGSNDDVKKLFVSVLKKPVASADAEAIKGLGPEADLVLQRRKFAKLHSTYVSAGLPDSPVLFKGRWHPVVSTTRTRTWRTSSDSPNSQNYPKYGEGKEAREMVEPGGDYRVVAFDFAGIQARNVAMESKDKTLVRYFKERYDIHSDWMERVARRHPRWIKEGVKKLATDKDVKKHYRQQSKNKLVFPLFFGAGARTTSSGLGVPEEIGFALGNEFKEEFPGIAEWHKTLRKFYRKNGYVTGLSGFRRRAPVAATEIINTPIQSDESVIVLDSLIRLTNLGEDDFIPTFEIHDDLTFIWHKRDIDKNAETVVSAMLETSYDWAKIVPLGVEMSVGTNWANLEHVGEYYSDQWNGTLGR